jgi:hypothetical protein
VRLLDDEKSSLYGTFSRAQKVNFVISDLRLGHLLILERSKVTTFDESDAIEKQYYRHIQDLATGTWLHARYEFKFMNDRAETICIRKRYFRDVTGTLVYDDGAIVGKGETFEVVQLQWLSEPSPNYFSPFSKLRLSPRGGT